MSKAPQELNTSTVLDLYFKNWLDQYPPEKTTALQDRVLSLGKTLRELNEKFTSLQTAKGKLSNLYKPLSDALNCLNDARFSHADFIKTYGDLGVSTKTPTSTMESTIAQYMGELKDYADRVSAAYLSNLDEVKKHIDCLYSLRSLYENLFLAITTIRDSYFKTEPNRRKPIIRELYRIFSSIGSNHSFFGAAPTIEDSLISPPIDKGEWDSLLALRREAENAAKAIKTSR